jgi:hypothetical protein
VQSLLHFELELRSASSAMGCGAALICKQRLVNSKRRESALVIIEKAAIWEVSEQVSRRK